MRWADRVMGILRHVFFRTTTTPGMRVVGALWDLALAMGGLNTHPSQLEGEASDLIHQLASDIRAAGGIAAYVKQQGGAEPKIKTGIKT